MMPRDRILLDTSGWIALLNASDGLHPEAVKVWQDPRVSGDIVVVTDWIVAETGNGLSRSPARSRFAQTVRQLIASPHAEVVFVDEVVLSLALQPYEARADKSWGLVDCASMVVMRQEGITDAFSCDRHFTQAGFRCLLTRP
jgi:predicted nucleic acid-binding protein